MHPGGPAPPRSPCNAGGQTYGIESLFAAGPASSATLGSGRLSGAVTSTISGAPAKMTPGISPATSRSSAAIRSGLTKTACI